MYLHHSISEATAYEIYNDKILNSFYIKDNKANLVLNVQTEADINAKAWA